MEGPDAFGGHVKGGHGCCVNLRTSGVYFGLGDLKASRAGVKTVKLRCQVIERVIAARLHVADDALNNIAHIGCGFTLGMQQFFKLSRKIRSGRFKTQNHFSQPP